MTPDSRIGWIGPALRSGWEAIRRRPPDVIYSTSPYMSAHLIALILSGCTRTPWVADFRDPWRENPFRGSRFASVERWDAWLEWLVLRCASHVVCSTPTMADHLCGRRPFVARKCTTIMNGFDRELFRCLRSIRIAPADEFVLTHCGQFYGRRIPKVWFAALGRVLERSPELASKIHLVLLGPDTYDGQPLAKLAATAGIGDRVRVLGPKSHAEALSYMAGSDALMLAGSAGPGSELQVPNKLFEYLAVRKPIIATFPPGSPVVNVLREARAETIVCDPNDEQALADAIIRVAVDRHVNVEDAWAGVSRFDREHRAMQLGDIFRSTLRRRFSSVSEGPRGLKPAAQVVSAVPL